MNAKQCCNFLLNGRENMPNTIFLCFNQASLRLRHLTQVIGFNLNSSSEQRPFHANPLPSYLPQSLVKSGYYFTLESSVEGKTDYRSELNPSSSPCWETFDCSSLFPIHILSQKGIIIRVWEKENDKNTPVTSWGVNFSGLVPLSSKPISLYEYNPNTLIFKMKGRYYTSYDSIKNLSKNRKEDFFKLHLGCSLSLSETKPSYSVSSLCKFHSNKRTLKIQEGKKENLKASLYMKGVKNDSKRTMMEKKIEDTKIRICLLMEQLNVEINKLSSISSASENQDFDNQDKGVELLEGYQNLNKQLSAFKIQENSLREDNNTFRDVVAKVYERRCQLLSQLHLIFPVERSAESTNYSICKVNLPDAESYEGYSEQSLSVGLGFVTQLFVKIAFLINIPLKYPVTLRGSLSYISDLTSTQLSETETLFPLHTRGKEREKLHFHYGVFLLNKNIAQLRWNCGLPTSDLRQTLHNVWHFLCSLHDISQTHQRVCMPDTIVPLLVLPASLKQNICTPSSFLEQQAPRMPVTYQNSKTHNKSLPDTPSSPKNSFLKKDSSGEDSYFDYASDGELKAERRKMDGTQSDMDASSYPVKPIIDSYIITRRKESQRFHKTAATLKPVSFSLDQGIDSIKDESRSDTDFMRTFSLNSSLCSSNIPSSCTGSFPILTHKREEEYTSQSDSHFDEQTTQLLKSWHENDPSLYHSSVGISNSTDQLSNQSPADLPASDKARNDLEFKVGTVDRSQEELETVSQSESKKNDPNYENESEKEAKIKNEEEQKTKGSLIESYDNSYTKRLVKELGISLDDIELDDGSILEDVASRAANLASQNCSFKLSFSRQSPGD